LQRGLVWSGILLSLVFAALVVRDTDFGEVADALADADYAYLVPAGLTLAAGVAVRAWRWQLLFERSRRPRYGPVANALLVGYLFNTILPARAGEVARVQVLGTRANVSRAEVLATVVLERAYDLLVLIVLLAAAARFLPPVGWLEAALALGGAVAIMLVAAAILVARYGRRGARLVLRPLLLLPRVDEARLDLLSASFVAGLAAIRASHTAVATIAVTTFSWLLLAASNWFLMRGMGIEEGFAAALLVLVATNLVLVLPSSPAGLGAFEAATVLALGAFGVERELALSYALGLHALNALPFIPIGAVALWLSRRRDR
jgi:hypothetical protein